MRGFAISFFCTTIFFVSAGHAAITYQDLRTIDQAFHAEYDQEFASQNAVFTINKPPTLGSPTYWWDLPNTRASYASYTDDVTGRREHGIFFFGGLGAMPAATRDSAVMAICHEIGHGIAGPPYKDGFDGDDKVSIEAMADDYAARICFRRMTRRIADTYVPPLENESRPPTQAPASAFVADLCERRFSKTEDRDYCLRAFRAFEFDRIFYRTEPDILEETSFESIDPTLVTTVNTGSYYRPPAQCRIDTIVAGLFGDERPRCWWVP